jgi:hypothetical protein
MGSGHVVLEPEFFIRLHAFDNHLCFKVNFNKSATNANLIPLQNTSDNAHNTSLIPVWLIVKPKKTGMGSEKDYAGQAIFISQLGHQKSRSFHQFQIFKSR